jgi:hypothetical protein
MAKNDERGGFCNEQDSCSIFECKSLLCGSFFEGDDQSFLMEGVKICMMTPMVQLNSTFFPLLLGLA